MTTPPNTTGPSPAPGEEDVVAVLEELQENFYEAMNMVRDVCCKCPACPRFIARMEQTKPKIQRLASHLLDLDARLRVAEEALEVIAVEDVADLPGQLDEPWSARMAREALSRIRSLKTE